MQQIAVDIQLPQPVVSVGQCHVTRTASGPCGGLRGLPQKSQQASILVMQAAQADGRIRRLPLDEDTKRDIRHTAAARAVQKFGPFFGGVSRGKISQFDIFEFATAAMAQKPPHRRIGVKNPAMRTDKAGRIVQRRDKRGGIHARIECDRSIQETGPSMGDRLLGLSH